MKEVIRAGLLLGAAFFLVSSAMWTITEPNDRWLWFSRAGLGAILLGISACIKQDK